MLNLNPIKRSPIHGGQIAAKYPNQPYLSDAAHVASLAGGCLADPMMRLA
jgi:hypothetical protein